MRILQILKAVRKHGLGVRLHSDEFKPIGGTELARDIKAISADHLTAITEEGIAALRDGDVIPVTLPATTYFLAAQTVEKVVKK